MRRWLVTLLGVVMMAASVYGYGRYVERMETEATTVETIKPVRLIASGETVDGSMLRRVMVPLDALDPEALQDAESIIGKTAVAPIGPNEQLAAWKLAERQLTPKAGERYISFSTDDVANVGNMIRKGDRVDVWVEFAEPMLVGTGAVGALKVIEGLRVASVRVAEGVEVTDGTTYDAPFQSAARQQERVRGSANGKPVTNTFLMSEDVYEAYTLAALSGRIKLALPDLSLGDDLPARVTGAFGLLQSAGPISREGGEQP